MSPVKIVLELSPFPFVFSWRVYPACGPWAAERVRSAAPSVTVITKNHNNLHTNGRPPTVSKYLFVFSLRRFFYNFPATLKNCVPHNKPYAKPQVWRRR